MKLDRVTITGADDSVEPADLLCLSREFPFVEWGILVSKSSMSGLRFPSEDWLWKFRTMTRSHPVQASMHLCGRWLRELLIGSIAGDVWTVRDAFQRIQLNLGREPIERNQKLFQNALESLSDDGQKSFIFQIATRDGWAADLFRETQKDADVTCSPLFDASGGKGISPSQWPEAYSRDYHGYAGNLGPDNLAEQIPLIAWAADDCFGGARYHCRVWIDMESKVRSDNDRQFDLEKVRQCLEIAKPFVVEGMPCSTLE